MSGFRIASGGLIDRAKPVSFTFDGKHYQGYAGDTLASALLANGVKLVGRSFKYHRPRGILSAGSEEPNALVELRTGAYREPNTRATMAEIFNGLEASSQNRGFSLKYDPLAVNNLLSPFFAAGFYYKTFMWPAKLWEKFYEPMIRRAAGLGRNAGVPDPDTYEKTTEFCDVLVIGGGADGLCAAREAAASGGRVLVCDENAALETPDLPANVKFMPRTTVFAVYDGGTYAALERLTDHLPVSDAPRQRLTKIVAERSILATGALERPMVFGHNDKPGSMLAGAVAIYITRYGVAPGRNAVLFINNDDAASLIPLLVSAKVQISGVVDSRPKSSDLVHDLAREAGVPVFAGAVITRALGCQSVKGAEIRLNNGGVLKLECDLIASSGGFNPNVALTSHFDGKPVWDDAISAFIPGNLPPGMEVIGKAAGQGINLNIQPCWHVGAYPGKSFVDFQNDVTVKDIRLAHQEGFSSVEHVKRYTTLGMATDQGKTANVNALALLAEATGKTVPETGTTRFRPPYTPVAIGALAGPHKGKFFKPTRCAPTHEFSEAQGAVFVETGMWLRAQYYPRAGEDWLAAAQREVNTVRNHVGICDVTTLGKIDIQGPDAAKFLECVYTNSWTNLAVGRVRYGLMLREDGMVMDDGTTARLGKQHFVMTTTTANAAKVMQHLEFCSQVLWPELDVTFISVTDQWAQIAVAGPDSRATLEKLVDAPFDIGNEAFPYMGCAELTICGGTPARLFRISFSGELAYEIAVPARYGNALAAKLMEAGAEFGIAPYGTEALGIMRIEKGHAAGPELNGQTTAHDLGLHKLLSKKKDFIGRALAARPALTDPARPTLVGLRPVDGVSIIRAGSHLLPVGAAATAENDQGHVSSAARSPSLGSIALALLANGPARIGEQIRVYDPVRNGDTLAEIVNPVHYDPSGSRLHA
ncbi:2Fe-2S iron-sulfur cluster-binding protein [Acidocella aromatica]|uniref:Sarcosine oxidase subunit alpha n=1 Tax=Acidocella aromatica TaxID=1303579 RepID=A0A840VC50_9PROT|nr:2Fe-2S iron-sulfur cluster-binding protein [Acidocella aromatica]MBB5373204.1 sarcosine oxidase subunit alpha [Acidocella aromatica]